MGIRAELMQATFASDNERSPRGVCHCRLASQQHLKSVSGILIHQTHLEPVSGTRVRSVSPQEGDAFRDRERELESKADALTKKAEYLDQEAARLKGIEIELKSREKRLQGREATVDAQYRKSVRGSVPGCTQLLRPRLAMRKSTSPKSPTSPKNAK